MCFVLQIANSTLDASSSSLLLGVVGKLFRHAVVEQAHRVFGRRLSSGDPVTDAIIAANALAESLTSSSAGGETSTISEGSLSGLKIQVQVGCALTLSISPLLLTCCVAGCHRRPHLAVYRCLHCQMIPDSRAMRQYQDECCLGTRTRLRLRCHPLKCRLASFLSVCSTLTAFPSRYRDWMIPLYSHWTLPASWHSSRR
jgi:hypothetical protein